MHFEGEHLQGLSLSQGPSGSQVSLGWAELGRAPGPWKTSAEPRLPASASTGKLKKDALGGAPVLNKTQVFLLAVVRLS